MTMKTRQWPGILQSPAAVFPSQSPCAPAKGVEGCRGKRLSFPGGVSLCCRVEGVVGYKLYMLLSGVCVGKQRKLVVPGIRQQRKHFGDELEYAALLFQVQVRGAEYFLAYNAEGNLPYLLVVAFTKPLTRIPSIFSIPSLSPSSLQGNLFCITVGKGYACRFQYQRVYLGTRLLGFFRQVIQHSSSSTGCRCKIIWPR